MGRLCLGSFEVSCGDRKTSFACRVQWAGMIVDLDAVEEIKLKKKKV